MTGAQGGPTVVVVAHLGLCHWNSRSCLVCDGTHAWVQAWGSPFLTCCEGLSFLFRYRTWCTMSPLGMSRIATNFDMRLLALGAHEH